MSISITDNAAKRILQLIANKADKIGLRLSVEGGGCSGFSYKYELVEKQNSDDLIIEHLGASLFVDPLSLPFLTGAKIDFVDDLMGRYFKIDNPNSTSSCGCGTSFSI